jgi:2-dehydro-3-deoxyphosphooctonate aldolase (KDO 8-P synthase)
MQPRIVRIGKISIGPKQPLALIAGPDSIEGERAALRHAEAIAKVADRKKVPFIFKCSYDKANRTSGNAFRGPGLKKGLAILKKVRTQIGVPVLSDVHCVEQAEPAAEVLDCIQIPAFLCRQTDLLTAVAKTGKAIHVKKGQFMAPWDMKSVVEKIESAGGRKILMAERGTSFGYNYLINDMRSLPIMRALGYPVVFDAGHSTMLPGGLQNASGGQAEFIPLLARAAVAAGCDALFVEAHENPKKALCDGPSSLKLSALPALLDQLTSIRKVVAP